MNAPLPGLSSPAVGFEVPLAMLSACHGRVEAQCETLQRLHQHLAQHGADRAAQEAAQAVMRYFDTAAVHHHADEERDLFPALLAAAPAAEAEALQALITRLLAEHRVLTLRWQALRAELAAVAAGTGRLTDALLQDFRAGYATHIAREEAELLPQAQRLLDAATLDHLGRAMRERRGVSLPA